MPSPFLLSPRPNHRNSENGDDNDEPSILSVCKEREGRFIVRGSRGNIVSGELLCANGGVFLLLVVCHHGPG